MASLTPNRQSLDTSGSVVPFPSSQGDGKILPRINWRNSILSSRCLLTPAQRLAALAVEAFVQADDAGQLVCFVSLERLAVNTGLCERTVRAALGAVVDAGYLYRARGQAVMRGGQRMGRASRTSYTYGLVMNRKQFLEHREATRVANLAASEKRRAAAAGELAAITEQLVRVQAAHALDKIDGDTLQFETARLDRQRRNVERVINGGIPARARTRPATRRTAPTLAGEPRADAQLVTKGTQAATAERLDALRPAVPIAAAPGQRAAVVPSASMCNCGGYIIRRDGAVFDADSGGLATASRHVCVRR